MVSIKFCDISFKSDDDVNFFKTISSPLVYISKDSPSLMRNVFLISFGNTILPKSSILLTTPVDFIKCSLLF